MLKKELNEEQAKKIVTPQEIQKVYELLKSQGKEDFTREEFFKALNETLRLTPKMIKKRKQNKR